MTDDSGLYVDSGDGWQPVPGVAHVEVTDFDAPLPWVLAVDLGLAPAGWEPPTPLERALAILAPHLADEPRYRP